MAGSSLSNQPLVEPAQRAPHKLIGQATFPIYIVHGVSGCRLRQLRYGGPNPQNCVLTYFRLLPNYGQTDIVTVLSSEDPASVGSGPRSYSPESWPHMPLDVNAVWDRALREIVGRAVPDADPFIAMQVMLFYQIILTSPEAQVYDYRTASALNFQVFNVTQPFPFHHAYAEAPSRDLRVIVQAAGLSRPEFVAILESLIAVKGTDEILHAQFKEAGIER